MADELDVLLEKVADPGLRAELRAAVDKVRAKRSFGLVFEAHLPERVRLPEYPVRRGTKVVRRADKNSGPMKVEGVRRGQATVVTDDGTRDTVPLDDPWSWPSSASRCTPASQAWAVSSAEATSPRTW
jgi:hypothetical protein